ncbi:hypothetical protein NCAS_0F02040 [Naumovozyma castellii]|uniref:Uncharacterized protein n=1 Tax=Naumovozyma castellii TaxID=27288 RepID=G0VGR7_NAUCA|nr:hypothetical protein NCAS_0F02040 [Naumovozyma castellii CBS 4309]CCC70688.1 hypothetical protein NCAS_0F02040 [Naumovozyma castellii CBS 4309]
MQTSQETLPKAPPDRPLTHNAKEPTTGKIHNKFSWVRSSLSRKREIGQDKTRNISELFPFQGGVNVNNNNDDYNRILLSETENNNYISGESTRTFLSENNNDSSSQFQQFPDPPLLPNVMSATANSPDRFELATNVENKHFANCNDSNSSMVLTEDFLFPSTRLHFKDVTLNSLKKRLVAISQRKIETCKENKKFLGDLSYWGTHNISTEYDTARLVREVQELFNQDLIFEQNIVSALNKLIVALEFVAKRESELISERKILQSDIKKYQKSKDKRGEYNEETRFLLEKLHSTQNHFENIKVLYQKGISVTTRKLFKDLGVEYYDRASDLKEASSRFIINSLSTLENVNPEDFEQELDDLRRRRIYRVWQKLTPNDKINSRKLENIKTGVYDCNDSLLKDIYKKLPEEYTPIPPEPSGNQPVLKFPLNGFDETVSFLPSNTDNPITTKAFLSEPNEKYAIKENNEFDNLNVFVEGNFSRKLDSVSTEGTLRRTLKPTDQKKDNLNLSQTFDEAERMLIDNPFVEVSKDSIEK